MYARQLPGRWERSTRRPRWPCRLSALCLRRRTAPSARLLRTDSEGRRAARRPLEALAAMPHVADAARFASGNDNLQPAAYVPAVPEDALLEALRPKLPALAAAIGDHDVRVRRAAIDVLEQL